ncbi:MAG: polyprenol monophosphomannose synthase [Candidatus Andersenbacteria bacterium]|nr:polyprenol monophosphomannose synthase [Candidatus Andersenbacteria bacterium]
MITSATTLILIPTYNEAQNIGLTLSQIMTVDPFFNVLVLDDNSPDGTAAVVRACAELHPSVRVLVRTTNRGFAQSYVDGFRLACSDPRYQAVITMDADFSHEPKELPALVASLNQGADMVVGSRYARRQAFPHITLWRRFMSRFANFYVRAVLGLPMSDCTAGFIAMRIERLKQLSFDNVRTEGYGFLFQLKNRAYRAGWKLAEHAVAWPERHQGSSKMNIKRIFESFLLPWKIKFQG